MWLSGYFAGAAAATPSSIPAFQDNLLGGQARAPLATGRRTRGGSRRPRRAAAAVAAPSLTIISASHTNNGRKISEKLLAAVQALGMQARMIKAGDYQPREIAKEKLLYVVISTHGDGDPPDEARGLYEFLGTKRAPQLPELQYSVLALGDSSYPKFCEAGRVVDERLAKLGAKRLLPRVDCDVDFEKLAQDLGGRCARARARDRGQAQARGRRGHARCPPVAPAPAVVELTRAQSGHRRSAREPAHRRPRRVARSAARGARVPGPRRICTSPATRSASCIAIRTRAIEAVLKATKLDGGATVAHDGKTHTLLEWLRDERELTRIARPLLVQVAKQAKVDIAELLGQCAGHGQTHRQLPGVRRAGELPGGVDAAGAGRQRCVP